jgi:N-acetylmuramoyl-L-alanine amidase
MKISNIEKIIVHCAATREGDDSIDAATIDRWHKSRGWRGIGYHFVVLIDGTIQKGRDLDVQGAHASKENPTSWGVCYIGGVEKDGKTPKDTRTDAQKKSMLELLKFLKLLLLMQLSMGTESLRQRLAQALMLLRNTKTYEKFRTTY